MAVLATGEGGKKRVSVRGGRSKAWMGGWGFEVYICCRVKRVWGIRRDPRGGVGEGER